MLTTLPGALLPLSAQEQQPPQPAQEQQLLSETQLQQLVAPIALYPDSLLAQVLTASTYPLEVAMAARWSEKNPKLKGAALENEMQNQSWDPSVKGLTSVPQVLAMMNDKLDWTQQLRRGLSGPARRRTEGDSGAARQGRGCRQSEVEQGAEGQEGRGDTEPGLCGAAGVHRDRADRAGLHLRSSL